ncbi:MAG: hypothetical protein H0T79_08970 [Deltaproteobacteria bacterium]|nr:hypothetical protein [Deltaproteobacteria bacterium]
MARQRRSGGFKTPEFRGTLGTLLRTTLQQAGVVRDALERGAREGRARIDDALNDTRQTRRRQDALAELGEIVLDLIRRGEIDPEELPEIREIVHHLDGLDASEEPEGSGNEEIAMPPTRERFDTRGKSPTVAGTARRAERVASGDDGTVSSTQWAAPAGASASRVWRPPVDDGAGPDVATTPPPFRSKAVPTTPMRKGGISFEDDEDLADYMHPDDVPAKPE